MWVQVEFNKAALSLAETIPSEQRKVALNRLLKVSSTSYNQDHQTVC